MKKSPIENHLSDECRMLLEYVRDAVLFIREDDGSIVAANRVAEETYGYPIGKLVGMRIFDLLDPAHADPNISEDDSTRGGQITEAGALFEASHMRADGTAFPVENSARIAVVDGVRMVVAVVRDISERRRVERLAEDALSQINQVFDTAADGMRIIDKKFNMTRLNHTLAEVAGIDYDTAVGMKCYDAFPGKTCHTPDCALRRALRGEEKLVSEVQKTRSDGTTVTCLLTSRPFVVGGKTVGVIEDFRDITERKAVEELAQHLATHDALTGLPNRLLFTDRLELTLAQTLRGEAHPALMFCDVDDFKAINDTLGHVIGDGVLQSIADSLLGAVRAGDTVARLGGDEFVVLLPRVKSVAAALTVARKILKKTHLTIPHGESDVCVALSIGVALYEDGDDDDTLMRRADDAMYRVKASGGNGVMLAGEVEPSAG